MPKSPKKFSELLTQAVTLIKVKENKNLGIIQDELGYSLNRENGTSIEYWRKGHIPGNMSDIEILTRELVNRGGLDRNSCQQFLESSDYHDAQTLLIELFGEDIQSELQPVIKKTMSPFVIGPPITHPRQFFGRKRELKQIFNLWQQFPLQHMAIVGKKRSGKTSLLYHLMQITQYKEAELRYQQKSNWLKTPQAYRWILVDFQDVRMCRKERLLQNLLKGFKLKVPVPCTLESFMDTVSYAIHTPTIILMDEIGAALRSQELDLTFWWTLRSLANHYTDGNLSFVIASHDLPMLLSVEVGKPSPFFNMFNILKLGAFTFDEAYELINSSPKPFSREDKEWIVEHSERWPALVQILCQARLDSLEDAEDNEDWQKKGQSQIEMFRYLLESEK